MQLLRIEAERPDAETVALGVEWLRQGRILAAPTETFYGLCCDSTRRGALRGINALKGKPAGSPVLLLAGDVEQAAAAVASASPDFERLAARWWPGPLTLVLHAAAHVAPEVGGGRGTVGLRVPGLALPRHLALGLGHPISGVSANPHGVPPPRTADEVRRAFGERIELLLDGGPTRGEAPSTVLDLLASPPRVLRVGAVPVERLREELPELVVGEAPGPPG